MVKVALVTSERTVSDKPIEDRSLIEIFLCELDAIDNNDDFKCDRSKPIEIDALTLRLCIEL